MELLYTCLDMSLGKASSKYNTCLQQLVPNSCAAGKEQGGMMRADCQQALASRVEKRINLRFAILESWVLLGSLPLPLQVAAAPIRMRSVMHHPRQLGHLTWEALGIYTVPPSHET